MRHSIMSSSSNIILDALTDCKPIVVVLQITAEGEYAPLCTFLETLLTMIW